MRLRPGCLVRALATSQYKDRALANLSTATLSDVESSDDEQVPAQKSLAVRKGKPAAEPVEESEEGSDEDDSDE